MFLSLFAVVSLLVGRTVAHDGNTVDWKYDAYAARWDYTLTVPKKEVQEQVTSVVGESAYGIVQRYFGASGYYAWNVIIRCETGGTFSQYSTGRHGERGLFQIHPIHIGRILAMGYAWDDMYSVEPNVAVAYAIWLENGWGPWSCHV